MPARPMQVVHQHLDGVVVSGLRLYDFRGSLRDSGVTQQDGNRLCQVQHRESEFVGIRTARSHRSRSSLLIPRVLPNTRAVSGLLANGINGPRRETTG